MNGQNSNDNIKKPKEYEANNLQVNRNNYYNKNPNDIRQELFPENSNNNMNVLNLNILNEEYDIHISNLKEQLSIVKEERKKQKINII